MRTTNRKIVMKQLPVGMPTPADFETVTESLGDIEDGQMLLRTRWLTLDPYMRSGFMLQPGNVTEGLDSAVDVFIGMLGGANFGKTMVRVSG